ncbi:MAG: hypothetical protein EYC70_05720 [Planctomycetota bacterium]|nr:MAG: hypothetical protein EYC70_05720 [Planctomycetota bacterium]
MSRAPDRPAGESAGAQEPWRETFTLEESGAGPELPEKSSWWASLVLVPLGLVGAAVGLFLFMSWLVGSGPQQPGALLTQVHSGGYNARKQAFFELMELLARAPADGAAAPQLPGLAEQAAALFDATTRDQALQRFADTEVLVTLRSPLAYERVLRMIEEARASGGVVAPSTPLERMGVVETDPLNPLTHGLQLLGRLGEARAVPVLAGFLEAEDPGVRMAAAFALGGIEDPAVAEPLRRALTDASREVRRNAALSLARRGDPAGSAELEQMLDPAAYSGYGNNTLLRDEQMLVALFALRQLRAASARAGVEALAGSRDVSGAVASAARQWLADLDAGWPDRS